MSGFDFVDNSKQVLQALFDQKDEALEAMGLAAEGFAKANLTKIPQSPKSWYHRTGRLRSSVSHARQGDDEYIGTNVDYAAFVC